MRKRGLNNNIKNIKRISAIIVLILILSVSIGYSALNKELTISNIAANINVSGNIKVSVFDVFSSSSAESYSNSASYEDEAIISNVHLSDSSSWVKYSVTLANLGNEEMGIANIINTLLPSDLTYVLEDYSLKDMVCDDVDTSKCSLGISKTFYITIKYKNGVSASTPTDYSIRIGLDFEPFYSVTYDSSVCTDCVIKAIGNTTFTVTLSNADNLTVTMGGVTLTSSDFTLNTTTKVLTINNVTGNIVITKNAGYTELFFLESTGKAAKQYINIGYVPKKNSTIIYDGMVMNGDTALFGSRLTSSGGTKKYTLQFVGDNIYRASFYGTNYLAPTDYPIATRYTFKMSSSGFYINDTLIKSFSTTDQNNFSSTFPLYLFAVNTNNVAGNFGSVRIYSMKIYEDENLVMDIIPVLDPDNNPCVYDKIGGDFYCKGDGGVGDFNYVINDSYTITNNITRVTSSNTATSIDINENYVTTLSVSEGTLPKALIITSNDDLLIYNVDYTYDSATGALTIYNVIGNIVIEESIITQLPFIKSSGTQYIDTGYTPNVNTKVVFTFIPTKAKYTTWMTFFGCRNGSANTDAFYASTGASNNISTISSFVGSVHVVNNENITFTHTVGATEVITMDAYNTTILINGEVALSADSAETPVFDSPNTMFIFGRNIGNGTLNAPGEIKLVEMQIYENNVLKKDFIPVVDEEGVPCLYEEVSETYYHNAGTGSFTLQ